LLPGDRPPNAFVERRPRTQAPKNENQRDIKGAQILVKDENDGWSIEDCNATGGHQAVLHSDDLGHFTVYARILGKPVATFTCAST
jgi:predicted aspartyl protease